MTTTRKSLFILPHNPGRFGDDDRYLLFTEVLKPAGGEGLVQPNPLYEKVMEILNQRMTKAHKGDREDKIDAIGFW